MLSGARGKCSRRLQLMDNLDWPNAVKEIQQAEKFLRTEGSIKVASLGFCMGKPPLSDPTLNGTCQVAMTSQPFPAVLLYLQIPFS